MLVNSWRYYLISALFCASRMGIGATSVVYMLSVGAKLSDIAVVKIVQALVIFFAEIPTGLVADTFGRRFCLICAVLSSLLSFAIFGISETVIGFSIAEIFNGLCIAFWSGAFEAIAVEDTQVNKLGNNAIEYFFARMSTYSSFATMMGGLVGGIVGKINLIWPFFVAATGMLMTLFCMFLLLPKERFLFDVSKSMNFFNRFKNVLGKMNNLNKEAWKYSFKTPLIRQFFFIQIMIQFAIQPMLHYWQPYFQNIEKGITTQALGVIFFAYTFSQLIFSGIVSWLYEKHNISSVKVNFYFSSITLICFIFMLFIKNFILAAACFIIMQGVINIFRNNLSAGFNRFVSDNDRATILSTVSFVSRIGMLANLVVLKYTANLFPISLVYITSVVGIFFATIAIVKWNRYLITTSTELNVVA